MDVRRPRRHMMYSAVLQRVAADGSQQLLFRRDIGLWTFGRNDCQSRGRMDLAVMIIQQYTNFLRLSFLSRDYAPRGRFPTATRVFDHR